MTRAKQPDRPVSLFEACSQEEEHRHAARLRELAGMKAKLLMLDAYMPLIRTAGLELNLREIEACYPSCTLRISAASFVTRGRQKQLVEILMAAGFKVAQLDEYTSFQCVTLKKGRLQLRVMGDANMVPAQEAKQAAHP